MKLKGIKGIALVGIVALLVMASMTTTALASEKECPDEGRYWWERADLTPCEREMTREVYIHLFEHYFGIDVSDMSPEEFEEARLSWGEVRIAHLFWIYREWGIPDFSPPPPLRLLSIEERWEGLPGTPLAAYVGPPIAIYGRARTYTEQTEIEEWMDTLRGVEDKIGDWLFERCSRSGKLLHPISAFGICHSGYLLIFLNPDKMAADELLALAYEMYRVIAEDARAVGIEGIPVVFDLLATVRSDIYWPSDEQAVTTSIGTTCPRRERQRPIIGGVQMQRRQLPGEWPQRPPGDPVATTGFAVRCMVTLERSYLITGHLGFEGGITPVGMQMQMYQRRVCRQQPQQF